MAVYLTANSLFNKLMQNVNNENIYKNTRIPSVANTYQNEPSFQNVENLSRNYKRSGDAKFADPFPFHMKPIINEYNEGRKLAVLNTLKFNSTVSKPDVITVNPLWVVDYF